VQAIKAQQSLNSARMALSQTFPGLALPVSVPAIPDPEAPEGNWMEWQTWIVEHSHEVMMAKAEADRRYAVARRARLDRFADPTVGLRAFSERGGEETGLGVTVSIPLGGRKRSAESQAMGAQAIAAEAEAMRIEQEIKLTAQRDVLMAQSGLKSWRQTADALKNSDRALTLMQRAVELGERNLEDLLLMRRQHAQVRRDEAQARIMAHSALMQMRIDAHRVWGLGDDEEG
jgi:outer membrane protein TolC